MSLLWSVLVAEMGLGQLVGYVFASPLLDRFGRRRCLLLSLLVVVPAQLCHVLAQPISFWPLLYLGRFFTMAVFAFQSVIVPVFLSEISPPASRGALGTTFPLSVSFGALLGGFLGMELMLGSVDLWPFAFVIPLFCSLCILPLVWRLPETPPFLAAKRMMDETRKSLMFYHGRMNLMHSVVADSRCRADTDADEVEKQLKPDEKLPELEDHHHHETKPLSWKPMFKLLRKQSLRRSLLLSLVIACSFCCSGILIVSAYSTAILKASGLDWESAEYCTVALKLLSFLTYILCLFLVDRVGRRPLILSSIFGSALAWTVQIVCSWIAGRSAVLTTFVVFLAQFFMNVGIRPLFYVLVPELYPYRYRTSGKSLTAILGVLLSVPILFGFWPLFTLVGDWVFVLQAAPLWFCFLYLLRKCPETKGRLPKDIFESLKMEKRLSLMHPTDDRPNLNNVYESNSTIHLGS